MPPDAQDATTRLRDAIVPFIGVELPADFRERFEDVIAPIQDAARASDDARDRSDRIVNVWEGMLAVRYHRNEVERIERETIDRVHAEFGGDWAGPETTISIKMSTLGIANVAYLMAARSTLDYLGLAVARCFGEEGTHSINNLATTIAASSPSDLAEQVRAACDGLQPRFAHLLSKSGGGGRSPRDHAAHWGPITPPGLSVLLGAAGVRVALDTPRGQRLIDGIDTQIHDLEHFALELLAIAVKAERQRARVNGVSRLDEHR